MFLSNRAPNLSRASSKPNERLQRFQRVATKERSLDFVQGRSAAHANFREFPLCEVRGELTDPN